MWNELSAFDGIYNVNMNVIASPWHCHTSWTVAPIVPYQNVGICQIKLMQGKPWVSIIGFVFVDLSPYCSGKG